MMTADEIKTGLECCITDNCKGCPYYPLYEVFGCKLARAKDTLALIQQLEAQNAELIKKVEQLQTVGAEAEELLRLGGCDTCKYRDVDAWIEPCMSCKYSDKWEMRKGV